MAGKVNGQYQSVSFCGYIQFRSARYCKGLSLLI